MLIGWGLCYHLHCSFLFQEEYFHEDLRVPSLLCLSKHNPLLHRLDIVGGACLPFFFFFSGNSEDAEGCC